MSRGVVYIAYGLRAQQETAEAVRILKMHNDLSVAVIGERVTGLQHIPFASKDNIGRWAKVNLDRLSPFEQTLYLDADTRVHGDIGAGFEILGDGWDVVICPSTKQGTELLWHIDESERKATLGELREPVQLQGGAIFWQRNERTAKLFEEWRREWLRWQGQDQGALVRALHRTPVRLWLLDNDWNGGALIEHRYGAARRRDNV